MCRQVKGILVISAAFAAVAAASIFAYRKLVRPRPAQQGVGDIEIAGHPSLVDEFLPHYEFSEIQAVLVRAQPDAVFTAAKELTGSEISPLVGWLLRVRGLPGRLQDGPQIAFADDGPFLEALYRREFIRLAESAGSEIVFGVVGKFWEMAPGEGPDIGSPQEYLAFNDTAYAKVAANLLVRPGRESGTVLLSTETRIHIPDPILRRRFGRYWTAVSGGSGFIRRQWLSAIKRRAES